MTLPANDSTSFPIGMFDSGVGGLTVMQQLIKTLPYEHITYFGDTARLPYGSKSPETILRYSIENAIFLMQKQIKMLVVACNTASAYALENLQLMFKIPIIGVIDPGVESALQATQTGRIAVLGTKGTILSQSYQKAILHKASNAFVFPIACPLFVPLVEENCIDHPATRLLIRDYLEPLKAQRIDTLLLGCTHYPLLKNLIKEEIGEGIHIVDSAAACAEQVSVLLSHHGMQNRTTVSPNYRYFVSDNPMQFQLLGHSFLGMSIPHVESR
jgi:glutamate racemase